MAQTTGPRVVLHVGAPKSGTTFLQNALWLHRDALLEQGFRCPGDRQRDMFHAAIDVRRAYEHWGMSPGALEGSWARVCAEARRFEGTTVMSHELLAAATPSQVREARAHLEGLDVHVVFTARDLSRQLLSDWQERVKNGSKASFEEFREPITARLEQAEMKGLFWRFQDLTSVLARWGAELPASHVHVVVSPPSGSDPRELWHRFAAAVGFDADPLDPVDPDVSGNQSLGVTQTEILRRVNLALDGRIPQPAYAHVVKRLFSQNLLARHSSPRPACPPELVASLRDLAERWNRTVRERGYAVHGDLEELLPREASSGVHPSEVDLAQQAEISAAVIADLLVEVKRLRARAGSADGSAGPGPGTPPGPLTGSLPRRAWRRLRAHAPRPSRARAGR